MTDEYDFSFEAEWQKRQSEPIPEVSKKPKPLGIGIDEIPDRDIDKLHVRHALRELVESLFGEEPKQ